MKLSLEKNLNKEIEKYVESKRGIWSNRTCASVGATLRSLAVDFSNPRKNYAKLVDAGRSRYTIKVYFTIAAKFEREAGGSNRYGDFLKKEKSAFKNCYKDKTRILRPEDYARFLEMYQQAENHNMYNLLMLMGQAGLRVSEALNAKWDDFFQDGDDIYLKVIGKGSKQRAVPFEPTRLLQTENKTGRIVGTVAFRFLFERDMSPFTPHDFRAYYATFIANHPELSIKDAAMLLGHADIKTTSRYVRSDIHRVAKVLKRV